MNKLLTLAALALICSIAFAATPDNCKTPSNTDGQCTTCNTGYIVAADSKSCLKCAVSNCNTCTATGYATACTGCADGYGVKSSDSSCSSCKVTNCATCSEDYETCDTCDAGYALDSNACTACDNGCKECDKVDDSCDACPTGRVLNKTDTAAQFCCPTNCLECNSASFCTSCNSGFNLNAEKGTCFGFKTGASLTLGAIISVALFSLLF